MILLKKINPEDIKPPSNKELIFRAKGEKYLRRGKMSGTLEMHSDYYNVNGPKKFLISEVEFWLDEIK